jgi:hypothetical protein
MIIAFGGYAETKRPQVWEEANPGPGLLGRANLLVLHHPNSRPVWPAAADSGLWQPVLLAAVLGISRLDRTPRLLLLGLPLVIPAFREEHGAERPLVSDHEDRRVRSRLPPPQHALSCYGAAAIFTRLIRLHFVSDVPMTGKCKVTGR